MLAPICALLFVQTGPPKDVKQLIEWVDKAYSAQQGYSDEWTMSGDMMGTTLTYKRALDGTHRRFEMSANGQPYFLSGSDGKTDFTLLFPAKEFCVEPTPKPKTSADAALKADDEQSFKFGFDVTGVQIACKFPMKIEPVKPEFASGKTTRHLVITTANPETGGRLQLDLDFWPNAWILTEAQAQVIPKGQSAQVIMHATSKIQTGQKFAPETFTLDAALVKDFSKVSKADLMKLLGG